MLLYILLPPRSPSRVCLISRFDMLKLVLSLLLVGFAAGQPHRNCADDNGGCDQICTPGTTSGPGVCSCEDGYVLDDDGHSCEDINECATNNGGCDQICINTQDGTGNNTDSNACACNPGYVLAPDGHSCDPTGTSTGGTVTVQLTQALYKDRECYDEFADKLTTPYGNDVCYGLQNPEGYYVKYHFGRDELHFLVSHEPDCSNAVQHFACIVGACCNISSFPGGSAEAQFAMYTWTLPATTGYATTGHSGIPQRDVVAEQVAGAVVGAVMGFLCMILIAIFMYRWHKRRQANKRLSEGYHSVSSPLLQTTL
eukprot:TRINITY_DN3805_c0_g1_i1.p1 TRINITY_DN3805_c0_g1~~TRINITY_DN3805_c0_g1_i1.p1  ORF type:complete len:312 (+),score=64.14 TRINITY_DN3805_c0_g1_i1:48-983(+)